MEIHVRSLLNLGTSHDDAPREELYLPIGSSTAHTNMSQGRNLEGSDMMLIWGRGERILDPVSFSSREDFYSGSD